MQSKYHYFVADDRSYQEKEQRRQFYYKINDLMRIVMVSVSVNVMVSEAVAIGGRNNITKTRHYCRCFHCKILKIANKYMFAQKTVLSHINELKSIPRKILF